MLSPKLAVNKKEGKKGPGHPPRNASKTKPAKFLVFLFKEKGATILVPQN